MACLLSVKQLVHEDHNINFSHQKGGSVLINGQTEVPLQLRHNLYQLPYRTRARPANACTNRPTTFAATHLTAPHSHKGLRYVVDICAGTSSAVCFHLHDDPQARSMSIDLRSSDWLRAT